MINRIDIQRNWLISLLVLAFSNYWGLCHTEKRIIFSFERLPNGTFVPVVRQVTAHVNENNDSLSSSLIASIFIFILFITGFVGSVLLITTIGSSLTLRRLPFNIILLNLGVICLLECVFNLGLSFIYLVTEPWSFGSIVCYLNSAMMELVPVIYTIILFTLIIDRTVALSDPAKYKKTINTSRQKIHLVLYWAFSVLVACPLAVGALQSWPFPSRYSCQIMDKNSKIYGFITGIVIYCACWLGMIVFTMIIHRSIMQERKKERKAMRTAGGGHNTKFSTHTAFFMANAHLWNEIRNVILVMTLIIIYLAFFTPYLIRVKVDQILLGYGEGYNFEKYKNLTLPYTESQPANLTIPIGESPVNFNGNGSTNTGITFPSTNGNINTTSDGGSLNSTDIMVSACADCNITTRVERDPLEVPEVKGYGLGIMDIIFIWLRYLHAALVPIIIFAIHKPLRKKTSLLLMCCWCWRPSSVHHRGDSPRPVSAYYRRRQKEISKQKKKYKDITSYSVPVLFATSDGLHLRLLDENFAGFSEHKGFLEESLESKSQWTVEPKFVTELCDLTAQPPGRKASMALTTIKEQSSSSVDDNKTESTLELGGRKPEIIVEPSTLTNGDHQLGNDNNSDESLLLPKARKRGKKKPKRKVKFNSNIQEIVSTPSPRNTPKKSPRRSPRRSPSRLSTDSDFLPPPEKPRWNPVPSRSPNKGPLGLPVVKSPGHPGASPLKNRLDEDNEAASVELKSMDLIDQAKNNHDQEKQLLTRDSP